MCGCLMTWNRLLAVYQFPDLEKTGVQYHVACFETSGELVECLGQRLGKNRTCGLSYRRLLRDCREWKGGMAPSKG